MAKAIILILCAFIAYSAPSAIQPFDLAEEAEALLDALSTRIRSLILLTDDDIQDLFNDFRSHAQDVVYDSNRAMQQEYQSVQAQITQIENLAQSAGKDVSSCSILGDTLQESSERHNAEISSCVTENIAEGLRVTRDAKYFVDIIMNKVHHLEDQLRSCRGDILCISPLITQIELYQVSLVQDIRKEISEIDQLLLDLKLVSLSCGDPRVAEYVSEASNILGKITDCANAILG